MWKQQCGEQGTDGHYAMGDKYKEQIGGIQSTLHSWWRRKIACPVGKIEDYVKLLFREHNPEADQMANLGTEGKSEDLN